MKSFIKMTDVEELFAPEKFYFDIGGFCPCCDQQVRFVAEHSWLRDHFFCTNCGSIPRERALMTTIEMNYPNWRELSIHESSPVDRSASKKLREYSNGGYIATHYYPSAKNGEIIAGFQNEDLESLTFPDESFDLVITQDVMEHIYNPGNAFREIARTLKVGGAHIFTVPIINHHKKTEIWATKKADGQPNFLQKPEYHGNPVDAKGSPVTMHWGFDIVDYIFSESGLYTTIEYIDDLTKGIRAEFIEVFVTRKTKP